MAEVALAQPRDLPVGPLHRQGVGWWGAGTLIASEAALFAYLLFSYYYLGAVNPVGWLLEPAPDLSLALPNTALLLASSVFAWAGESGVLHRSRALALTGFGVAFALGRSSRSFRCSSGRRRPMGWARRAMPPCTS